VADKKNDTDTKVAGAAASTRTGTPQEAARAELVAAGDTPGNLADALQGPSWDAWTNALANSPDYAVVDENTDQPVPLVERSLLVQYGDGPNDYIATNIENRQVVVRDGNDPSGKAWTYPEDAWRRFVIRLRGGDPADYSWTDPDTGRTYQAPAKGMYEAAAEQQERTNASIQADRDANAAAAQGNPPEAGADRSVAQPAGTQASKAQKANE
jgi:hypothetical protein